MCQSWSGEFLEGQNMKQNMKSILLFLLGCSALLGCDTEANNNSGAGGTSDNSQCPDINGAWRILAHCESSLEDEVVTIHQNGCDFDYTDLFPGWTGSVDSDNRITSTGNGMTCEGAIVGSAMSLTCSDGCETTLKKE